MAANTKCLRVPFPVPSFRADNDAFPEPCWYGHLAIVRQMALHSEKGKTAEGLGS